MKLNKENFDVNKFDAILFDFDGVLAESMNVKTEAFSKLFEKFGKEIQQKVVNHHIENGGISRYEKIKYYYKEYLNREISKDELNEIANHFSRLVVEKVISSNWIKGAKEFLEKYYNEIDFYIVSGTPQKELESIVEKRNMEKYFKDLYGTPDTKPDIARNIIKKHEYPHEKVLFIGDSLSDYKASVEAKIPFLGVVSNEKDSLFPKNTKFVKDFTDLL